MTIFNIRCRTLLAFTTVLALASCGKAPQNSNLPPTLDEISSEVPTKTAADDNWHAVLSELKSDDLDPTSRETLTASLAVPSKLVTDSALLTALTTERAAAIVSTAPASLCSSVESLTDIDPGKASGIAGLSGAFQVVNGEAKALHSSATLSASVYLMKYKLTGDSTNSFTALLTIPNRTASEIVAAAAATPELMGLLSSNKDTAHSTTVNYGYPLVIYSHASPAGLGYGEIAASFGQMQLTHIIAAPTFPGVPLCSATNASSECTGTDVAAAVGSRSTFVADPVHLLGLQDCIKSKVLDHAGILANNVDISGKVLVLNKSAADSGARKLYGLPVSYMVGQGSGATSAQLAIARSAAIAGVLMTSETSGDTFKAKTALNNAGMTTPNLFNCMIANAGQNIFSAGANKVLLDYWVKGDSAYLSAKKMALSSLLPGLSAVKARIETAKADPANDTPAKLAKVVVDYIKSIDPSMHTVLINSGLRNWAKALKYAELGAADPDAAATLAAAKGAGLMLHGTADKVADSSNTKINSYIYVGTSQALSAANAAAPGRGAPGVNWLSLGIKAPSDISQDDLQHGSSGFSKGTAATAEPSCGTANDKGYFTCGGFASNVNPAPYDAKTPAELTGAWLANVCKPSLYAAKGAGE